MADCDDELVRCPTCGRSERVAGQTSLRMRLRDTDATPAEAKAVWDSMDKPTYRRVALALTQAGRKVSFQSIGNWRRDGWTRKDPPGVAPQPMAELDAAVPVLTGDPMRRLDSLRDIAPADDTQTDEERLVRGLRELAACSVRVLGVVRVAEPSLILAQPDKIGILLERIAYALFASTACLAKLESIRAAAATNITPPEARSDVPPHPLAAALDAVRSARSEQATSWSAEHDDRPS